MYSWGGGAVHRHSWASKGMHSWNGEAVHLKGEHKMRLSASGPLTQSWEPWENRCGDTKCRRREGWEWCFLELPDTHRVMRWGIEHWGVSRNWYGTRARVRVWRPSITIRARSGSMAVTHLGSCEGQGVFPRRCGSYIWDSLRRQSNQRLASVLTFLPRRLLLSGWTNCSIAGKTAVCFAVLRGVRATYFHVFPWIFSKFGCHFCVCCCLVWNARLSQCSSGCVVLTCLDPPVSVCRTPGTYHYTTLRVSFTSFSSSDSGLQTEIGNNRGP